MKCASLIPVLTSLSGLLACGQGFIYDQQSSTDESVLPNGSGTSIQLSSPLGQSFTPNLTAVNFIRLNLNDNNPNNSLGGIIYLNLRTDTVGGTLLATTTPVTFANGFTGTADFYFASDVPLTPSATYAFELVIQLGSDSWNALAWEYNYPGGVAFGNGVPAPAGDLWFREGTIVPEPSVGALTLLGAGVLWWNRRKRRLG